MTDARYLLTLFCLDGPGIVARVAAELFKHGGNILESQQFGDTETGKFFMRIEFSLLQKSSAEGLQHDFGAIATRYDMSWEMRDCRTPRKTLILVSKFDHCLVDLLYRRRTGELEMDLVGIISNHSRDCFNGTDFGDVPFHHMPISAETKFQQEATIKAIVSQTGAELIILARYMQVLSDDMSSYLAGRCINIHHSFLPAFKGAKPYHQAHVRGVKVIGATAHYVTANLDEGPIIEQDTVRISHHDTAEDLVRKGRDVERRVLARAVALHLQGRVFANEHRTVVFDN